MADMKQYVQDTLDLIAKRDPDQPQFKNTVSKVLESVIPVLEAHPEFKEQKILERIIEPERVITFRVPWQDDKGEVHVNRGFRVQMSSAMGPNKGVFGSIPGLISVFLNSWHLSRCSRMPSPACPLAVPKAVLTLTRMANPTMKSCISARAL